MGQQRNSVTLAEKVSIRSQTERELIVTKKIILLMLLLAAGISAEGLAAQTEITLTSPENGATIYAPHPHLHWQKEDGTHIEDLYRIQVSSDEAFQTIVIDDSLDVVSRLVCAKPLPTGKYFWRVPREDQTQWSKVFSFTRGESTVFSVKKGSTQQEIEAVFTEAAANTPARVLFEQGDYTIATRIKLEKVKDLIIDGNGSKFTLKSTFLELKNCADITACNMTVTPERAASTNVDVLAVDPDAGTITVQVQPGFSEDFPSYFNVERHGNTIMRIVDEANQGLATTGWGTRSANKLRMEELGERRYRIHGLPASKLEKVRPGMVAYAKSYKGGFGQAFFVTRTTLSNINFMGMSGSIWTVSKEMNANSSLSCGFLPLTPQHYTGASGVIGKGGPDRGTKIAGLKWARTTTPWTTCNLWVSPDIQGNVLILKEKWAWSQDIREGEEFVLWDCMNGRATIVTILEVQDADGKPMVSNEMEFHYPRRLLLSKSAAELNRELGRPEDASFQAPAGRWPVKSLNRMLLIRLSHNNQDFVFRHNEVIGGSAGMLNNTTRALVAHNTFRNLREQTVAAGYIAAQNEFPIAGAGSRDYVIRDNTMHNCGRMAIRSATGHRLGGNIIIKNNTISYSADRVLNYAIVIGDIPGGVVKDNLFQCPLPPSRGAWISLGKEDYAVQHSNNRVDPPHPNVPIFKEQKK